MAIRTVPTSSRAITWWGRGASPFAFPASQLAAQAMYFLLQLPHLQIMRCMAPRLGMTPLNTFNMILGVCCLSLLCSRLTNWLSLWELTNSSLSWPTLAISTQDRSTITCYSHRWHQL